MKQRRFCDEYLIDLNGRQAAIRAGYSPKNAARLACRLLKQEAIRTYIRRRIEEKESRLIAKQDEVLAYLSGVMRREIKEQAILLRKRKRNYWAKAEDRERREGNERQGDGSGARRPQCKASRKD